MEKVKIIYSRSKPTTAFGEWMVIQMGLQDMSIGEVAEKLHITRQTVYNHMHGPVPFPYVLAYCWLFECVLEPEEIWEMSTIKI